MTNSITSFDVSILIPNYNNAEHLDECLKSVFSQKTTINYLVIIADDKSTDNSVEIIENYLKKFPEKTIFIKLEKNIGTLGATLQLYKKIETPYFTVLDGDDYWIDENFLQRSIDFLNSNLDYNIYANNTQLLFVESNEFKDYNKKSLQIGGYDSKNNTFLNLLAPHTSSTVFRNFFNDEIVNKLMEIYDRPMNVLNQIYCHLHEGDTFRNVIANSSGKVYCDYNKNTGVYRIKTKNSRWTSLHKKMQNILNYIFYFEIYFWLDYNKLMQSHILERYVRKLQPFFDTINIENIANENIVYNNNTVNLEDFINIYVTTVNKYNNLTISKFNPENIKYYVFFLPSKTVGEFEVMFTDFAKKLKSAGHNVSYIDYENGHFNNLVDSTFHIDFIIFPEYCKISSSEEEAETKYRYTIDFDVDVNLIIPHNLAIEVNYNLSEHSNVIYFNSDPTKIDIFSRDCVLSTEDIDKHFSAIVKIN